MKRETVEFCGQKLRHKPYSAGNERLVKERGEIIQDQLAEGEISRWEYYRQFFLLIFDDADAVNAIDFESDEFDGVVAEQLIVGFFPPSIQTIVVLYGLSIL